MGKITSVYEYVSARLRMEVLEMNNKALDYTALTLAIIGAVNWGLIGFFSFDLVAFIFGNLTWISRIIYAIVGVCGIYLITFYMYPGRSAEESPDR